MKSIFLFLMVLLTFSCYSQENNLYEIDPRTFVENKITLAEIADDITYIPLDNSIPIGIIYTYKILNNFIYLSAKDIGLLVFTHEGKLIKKIGKVGRGPGEYLFCMSFAIDNKTGNIYVMDRHNRIEVYSKTGRFLKNILLPKSKDGFEFSKLEIYNSNLITFQFINMGHAEYNWIVIDTTGNFISMKKNSILSFPGNLGAGGGTYKFENKVYYWNWYNDTVFSILPDYTYKVAFLFSQGEYRLPRSQLSLNQISQYMQPNFLFETKHFLVFRYFYKKFQFVLIEKNSKKSFLTHLESGEITPIGVKKLGGIFNDLDGGTLFQPKSYLEEDDKENLIEIINPYQLKAHLASTEFKNSNPKYPEKKKELEKLANSLKETDNPILMIVRLKK